MNNDFKFNEEWFGESSQQVLASLVNKVSNINGQIIEIGSWEGRSTCALANAAFPRKIHAVDTWNGSPNEISQTLATDRDIYSQWVMNIKSLTKGNVTPHKMGWRDYIPSVTEPIALCFIDAEHTYIEVRDNLLAIMPLMAPGGIICGDDVHHPPIRQALSEVLGEWSESATLFIWEVPS